MTNSQTSRYRKKKVSYYSDITWKNKEAIYEVIELPTNDVVRTFKFQEDAEEMAKDLNKIKPFGSDPLPNFLKGITW
tara:strand:+ start:1004 stop:1234 length:231 start_codon:yes stop_codon:yes gene_type:complete